MIFYNFFSRFLITQSLFLLISCSRYSSELAASIFSTKFSISSAYTSLGSDRLSTYSSWTDRFYCSSLFLAALAVTFLAFWARLPSSSGFSNLVSSSQRSSSMTPEVALAMCSMCALVRAMPIFLRTLTLRVFQFSIFLARELAGGQLCRLTNLGLQWWMSSAIITPSEKSRWMFFFAREKGILSTISYTSCSSYSCIQILQLKIQAPLFETCPRGWFRSVSGLQLINCSNAEGEGQKIEGREGKERHRDSQSCSKGVDRKSVDAPEACSQIGGSGDHYIYRGKISNSYSRRIEGDCTQSSG